MWAVEIDEVEGICHEIERTLNQKDMHAAIKVVREAFARPRNAFFVELVPLSSSGMVRPSAASRR
jgi:hypothetical protein